MDKVPSSCIGVRAAQLNRSTTASVKAERLHRVGSSSSPDGEAAVRPRLTLERQVTSRLLPDFTYQATGSSGRLCRCLDYVERPG